MKDRILLVNPVTKQLATQGATNWQRSVVVLSILFLLFGGCAHNPTVPKAPPNRPLAVVFDIDGTLTPRPSEFQQVREAATDAVKLYKEKGYKIFYLSARLMAFQKMTTTWLKKNNFPDSSSLFLAKTIEDVEHPDQFKTRMLEAFIENGWKLAFAYGDSSTDFEAYKTVEGLKSFALRPEEKTPCIEDKWKGCLNGWREHIPFIEKQP